MPKTKTTAADALDLESVTIGTLIELEDHAGLTLGDLQHIDTDRMSAKVIGAVRFLQLRAKNPAATWADAIATPIAGLADAVETEIDPE